MENRDVLQYIAEKSDDREALIILTQNERLNNENYFDLVFGRRYPDLIKYRQKEQNLKNFYLSSLKFIGMLKEEYGYTYQTGNPYLQYNLLEVNKQSNGDMNHLLIQAIIYNSIEILKYSLESGADVNLFRGIPLLIASAKGYLNIVRFLVENGASAHNRDDEALREAEKYNHVDVVEYLKALP